MLTTDNKEVGDEALCDAPRLVTQQQLDASEQQSRQSKVQLIEAYNSCMCTVCGFRDVHVVLDRGPKRQQQKYQQSNNPETVTGTMASKFSPVNSNIIFPTLKYGMAFAAPWRCCAINMFLTSFCTCNLQGCLCWRLSSLIQLH